MGFQKPSLDDAYSAIRRSISEIKSPYNDGWISSYCKQELYLLKCWLDEQYNDLPKFGEEESWEKDRLLKILKK